MLDDVVDTFGSFRKNLYYEKKHDFCLLSYEENIFQTGIMNNRTLQSLCLPELETELNSTCYTSSIGNSSHSVDSLQLVNCTDYGHSNISSNKICAMISINDVKSSPFENYDVKDFGAPLICINSESQKPILTGILSTNATYSKDDPGLSNLILIILKTIFFSVYFFKKQRNIG